MMDGIMKGVGGTGGGGRVGIAEEDMGDGMQCSNHPFRNNPGGICAFCLQEKLGKLVSSPFPLPLRGSSSSSSSPSFRSDVGSGVGVGDSNGGGVNGSATSLSLAVRAATKNSRNDGGSSGQDQEYYTRWARIPFLLARKKKKSMVETSSSSDRDIVFKRSKSTATPGRRNHRNHFLDEGDEDFISPRRGGGFWSFLYLSSSSSSKSCTAATKKTDKASSLSVKTVPEARATANKPKDKCLGTSLSRKSDNVVVEDDDSPNSQATASVSSFERKVSRSRSIGCGSRSFSGDFFERISTGFGDCTLRRVESHREGKPKGRGATSNMKERVKCGKIFGGFIISSSSSSSSSSYWVSSSAEDHHLNGKSSPNGTTTAARALAPGGRSRSWGWVLASPMRAFGKPSVKDGKRDIIREASNKNTAPNLSAIPSLLAARG